MTFQLFSFKAQRSSTWWQVSGKTQTTVNMETNISFKTEFSFSIQPDWDFCGLILAVAKRKKLVGTIKEAQPKQKNKRRTGSAACPKKRYQKLTISNNLINRTRRSFHPQNTTLPNKSALPPNVLQTLQEQSG